MNLCARSSLWGLASPRPLPKGFPRPMQGRAENVCLVAAGPQPLRDWETLVGVRGLGTSIFVME